MRLAAWNLEQTKSDEVAAAPPDSRFQSICHRELNRKFEERAGFAED